MAFLQIDTLSLRLARNVTLQFEAKTNTCEWQTVPIVFEMSGDTELFIGGFTELKKYFDKPQGRGEGTDGEQ